MKPTVVADVGNSRIKWGRCDSDRVLESIALPGDDENAWQQQLTLWLGDGQQTWSITGVHPARRDRLAAWLRERQQSV